MGNKLIKKLEREWLERTWALGFQEWL